MSIKRTSLWLAVISTSAFLFFDVSFALAISATNVQPSQLVASNKTDVTVTFTNAVTIPTDGKIVVIFPLGYTVSGATNGTCSTINGGFSTSVSGQTVTIIRTGTGSATVGAAQSCTIQGIQNPASTGSTGTYTISLRTNADTVLEEDVAVAADTIIAAGALSVTSVVPENLVTNITQRFTATFTTANAIQRDGKIAITFPTGFNVSGVNTPTCATMDGGFSVATSGQTVLISRSGTGTAQAASAENCTFFGVISPASVGSGGTYAIATLDSIGNTTDSNAVVTATAFVAPGMLLSTNVQPASLVAGAISTVTVTFTTVATTTMYGKVRVTFPLNFDVSGAGVATCASFTGTVSLSVSGQVVTISRSGTGTPEAPGVESCTITLIRNPRVSGATGTYTIEVVDNQPVSRMISSDLAVAFDTITAGVLTATNVQPETLVVNNTTVNTVTFTTSNPIPADGKIFISYPATSTFDLSGASSGTCAVMDGSIATSVSGTTQIILTRSGGTPITASTTLTCMISNIKNPSAAGGAGLYSLSTANNAGAIIDAAAPANDNFIAAVALTATNVQPSVLVSNIVSENAISFTISQNIPQEGKMKIVYPAGFVVSSAFGGTCTGFDGNISTSSSGQTVTLSRDASGTTKNAAAITCTVYGIQNPVATGPAGTYTITVTDKYNVNVGTLATVASDTMVAAGVLTATDIQPASLVAGTTNLATVSFTAVNGLPTFGKIQLVFPAGFNVSGAASGSCSGLSGSILTSVSGNVVTLTRTGTGTSIGAIAITCLLSNVKNPTIPGSTGVYAISTLDSSGTTISTLATVSADTISSGTLTNTNVEPETTLTNATSTATVTFTTANPLPATGKIVIIFPAGYSLAGVSSTSISCTGLTGSFTASTSTNTLSATRISGTTSTAGTVTTCQILNVRNPASAGAGGMYTIKTTTLLDSTIDEDAAVSSDTFSAAGTLTATDVQPSTGLLNTAGSATIVFTTTHRIPKNGRIVVTFPSGYGVSAAGGGSCSTMNGTFATTIIGQVVTITRNSDGATAASGTHSCILSSLTTPSVRNPGTYSIQSTVSDGTILDSDLAVPGDTFVDPSTISTGGGGGGGGGGGSIPSTTATLSPLVFQSLTERVAALPMPVHSLVKLPDDGNVKTQEDSAVYYLGGDGFRHAFPNAKVFATWYCDFSQVQVISAAELAKVPLGRNVPYRPGTRLVKFPSVPFVYVVAKGGILRPIANEALAATLYGPNWNKNVEDISEAFYSNYSFGDELADATSYNPSTAQTSVNFPSDTLAIIGYTESSLGALPVCTTPPSMQSATIPQGFQFHTDLFYSVSTGADVKYLQSLLSSLGFLKLSDVTVAGTYDTATATAVRAFQKIHGITQTGNVGPVTRAALNALF